MEFQNICNEMVAPFFSAPPCRHTAVCVFDSDPAISSCVVSFDHVRRTAAAPAADHEHYLVRHSRSCDRVRQIDVLAFFHVKVVQELDGLDDDRLALFVVVNQRMFLTKVSL